MGGGKGAPPLLYLFFKALNPRLNSNAANAAKKTNHPLRVRGALRARVGWRGGVERGVELLSRAQFGFGFLGLAQSSQGSAQLMMRRGVFRLPGDDAAKLRRRRLPIFDLHRRFAQCLAGFNETRRQLDG